MVYLKTLRFIEVQISTDVDRYVGRHFPERNIKAHGVAVPVDYPEHSQLAHFLQGFLHNAAVTGRAGLGVGGGIDDYGIALVVLRVSCRLVHLSVLSRVCR